MKRLLLRALAVVPILLLVTSMAMADQALYLSVNGVPTALTVSVCPTGGATCIYAFNGGTISVAGIGHNGGTPQIALSATGTSPTGTNTYTIDYVANNFVPTNGNWNHSESATLTGTDTGVSNIYYNGGNTLVAGGTLVDSLTLNGALSNGIATSLNSNGAFLFAAPYALTDEIILTLNGTTDTGQVTSSFNTSVPEPASLMLLGGGFLGLANFLRRKLVK